MVNSSGRLSPKSPSGRRVLKLPFEQLGGVLGFFVVSAAIFLMLLFLCFFYIGRGNRVAVHGGGAGGRYSVFGTGVMGSGNGSRESRSEGGGGRGSFDERQDCDLFEGAWVWDERYPLYDSRDCPYLDEGFRCFENGRPDRFYTKWRWQPAGCDLPRFDAKKMLEELRNRRLVFVGDSIGRNQWESLLCLLSLAVADKSKIYEVNGSPITKHRGFLVFRFEDYNCTVEYYRSPFLVIQSRPPAGVPDKIKMTLKLDIIDWMSSKWRDADVLIFNTGHWWNNEKTIRSGCYFQVGNEVMEMNVESAYHRSISTLFDWINNEVNTSRTQVFFRTYAPVHFRGGDWKTGGSCYLETLPDLGSSQLEQKPWAHFLDPFRDLMLGGHSSGPVVDVNILNVTHMTAQRRDGHLSLYYLGPSGPAPLHRQDCSHWCLPGVPDVWNELLYALFFRSQRQQSSINQNTSDMS